MINVEKLHLVVLEQSSSFMFIIDIVLVTFVAKNSEMLICVVTGDDIIQTKVFSFIRYYHERHLNAIVMNYKVFHTLYANHP